MSVIPLVPSWLLRLGAGVLAPYLLPIAVSTLIAGGGLTSWLAGWTDWRTAALLVACCVLVFICSTSNQKSMRVVMALVLGATLYLKGRIDESFANDAEVDHLNQSHAAEIMKLKLAFEVAAKTEQERQEQAAATANAKAAEAKELFDKARADLALKLADIKKGAADAPDAKEPVFGSADLADLNRLRYELRPKQTGRKLTPGTGPGRGKAKTSGDTGMDAPTVPQAGKIAWGEVGEGRSKISMGGGFSPLR